MSEYMQENKKNIWQWLQYLADPDPSKISTQLNKYYHVDTIWHGPHPINEINGAENLHSQFWEPLFESFPDLQRRVDIFLAGRFNDKDWVCSTGYYLGTFNNDWLSIPANHKPVYIRYGEFVHVLDSKIKETFVILDILDVMRQAGIWPIATSLGIEGIVPGPASHDGLLLAQQDEKESAVSLKLVEDMLAQLNTPDHAWAPYWHPNMMWYGPSGIGTTRGIDGFTKFHNDPWDNALSDWKGGHHYARIAEGKFVASGGWPSIYATHNGNGLFGTTATGNKVDLRVMDWWVREGDLLTENWVFIDIPDFLRQIGIDVFQRMRQQLATG